MRPEPRGVIGIIGAERITLLMIERRARWIPQGLDLRHDAPEAIVRDVTAPRRPIDPRDATAEVRRRRQRSAGARRVVVIGNFVIGVSVGVALEAGPLDAVPRAVDEDA